MKMKKYQFVIFGENNDVLYTACEYAESRFEALTTFVNYPHPNPLNSKFHQMDIHEVKD